MIWDDEAPQYAHAIKGRDYPGWLVRGGDPNEDGTIDFVASTADEDRAGDIVEQSWRLANFRRNPVFLNNHDHRDVVGKAESSKVPKETGNLTLRIRFDDSDVNPTGQLVAHQHRNGFRRAVSVGFRPGKSIHRSKLPADDARRLEPSETLRMWQIGFVYQRSELLELSSVSVPMNPAALQLSMYAAEIDPDASEDPADEQEAVRRIVEETLDAALAAKLVALAKTDPDFRRVVRAMWNAAPVANPNVHPSFAHLFGDTTS
jgi:phage head maturation protease